MYFSAEIKQESVSYKKVVMIDKGLNPESCDDTFFSKSQ